MKSAASCRVLLMRVAMLCALLFGAVCYGQSDPRGEEMSTAHGVPGDETYMRMAELLPAGPALVYLPALPGVDSNAALPALPNRLQLPLARFAVAPGVRAQGPAMIAIGNERRLVSMLVSTPNPREIAELGARTCGWSFQWLRYRESDKHALVFGEARAGADKSEQALYGGAIVYFIADEAGGLLAVTSNSHSWAAIAGRILQTPIMQVPFDYPTISSTAHCQELARGGLFGARAYFSFSFPGLLAPFYGYNPADLPFGESLLTGTVSSDPYMGTEIVALISGNGRKIPFLESFQVENRQIHLISPMREADIIVSARAQSSSALYDAWITWMTDAEFLGDQLAARNSEQQIIRQLDVLPKDLMEVFGSNFNFGINSTTGSWVLEIESSSPPRAAALLTKCAARMGASTADERVQEYAFHTIRWHGETAESAVHLCETPQSVLIANTRDAAFRSAAVSGSPPPVPSPYEGPISARIGGRATGRLLSTLGLGRPSPAAPVSGIMIGIRPQGEQIQLSIRSQMTVEQLGAALSEARF